MTEYIYDTSIEATFLHEQKRERIVRCKDCVHSITDGDRCNRWSEEYWMEVEPDGFCAWGERRNNE